MPAIALLVKESLSWLIKVVTTPRNIEYIQVTEHFFVSTLIYKINVQLRIDNPGVKIPPIVRRGNE